MAEQLSSLFVASLLMTLVGVVVFVNAILTYGLRWLGRRVSAFWYGRDGHVDARRSTSSALFEPPRSATPVARPSSDQPTRRIAAR